MIVRVYDFLSAEKPKFSQNLVGIVSDVESFKYTRRAYDIGSFEMIICRQARVTERTILLSVRAGRSLRR